MIRCIMDTLTNVDAAVKAAHIENIENRYKKADKKTDGKVKSEELQNAAQTDDEDNLVCPKCGSKLVLRVAKKGDNAGNRFYGCSAYPKCRYIKNVQ